jgi:hypothetical protein
MSLARHRKFGNFDIKKIKIQKGAKHLRAAGAPRRALKISGSISSVIQ